MFCKKSFFQKGVFMIFELIIVAIVAITFVVLFLLKDKIGIDNNNKIIKSIAIVLFVLINVRSFLNDNFIWTINGGTYGHVYYKRQDYLQSLLRWGLMVAEVSMVCAVFVKTRTIRNIAVYFGFPMVLLCVIFYSDFLTYFIENSGRAIYLSPNIRHVLFIMELSLGLIIPLLLRFVIKHKFDVKNKKEWGYFAILLPLVIITTIPVTLPQSLFGFTNKYMKPFTVPHLIWLFLILFIYIGLYLGFRFRNKDNRYTVILYLSLYLFLHYNQIYLMDFNMKRLPFQLCNLGAYLILISVIIKKQSFFNFVLIANVPGSLIALCMPDVNEGMLSYWNIHFYIEHMWVFIIPLLAVSLRIFERPKKNALKHFMIGFSCYFVVCALGGIVANCFLYKPFDQFFNKVNYFYIFDTTVLGVLPFLNFTRYYAVTWGGYTFYPLYMLLIYILFSIYCGIFYYIYKRLCIVGDNHFEVRKMRIDMGIEQGKYNKRIPKKDYDLEE